MKRDHRGIYGADIYGSGSSSSIGSPVKGKLWEEDQDACGMDELLAVLGYKVRSSDMADVAQKLEQLEMVMGTAQEDGISHLASDTIHYNPSNLYGWVQSMLTELNNPTSTTNLDPLSANRLNQKQMVYNDDSEYNLRVIPGVAVYPPKSETEPNSDTTRKRIKTSIGSSFPSSSQGIEVSGAVTESPTRPVVLVDSQETGVRLVHTLTACAEAIQQDNLKEG